jgi:glycosyltransferase involved in cell wall biosynthesis
MRSVPPPLGNRPWVAYIVPFPYPWGQAGSRRVDGISRSIAATGRDVVVYAMPGHGERSAGRRLVVTDSKTAATVSTINRPGLPSHPIRRQWTHHVRGVADALERIPGASSGLPSHVLVYGTTATPLFQAMKWGKRHNVPVILDVVERYAPQQFSGGRFAPGYVFASLGFAALAPRVDGVIAISRHLESHFARTGVPTVRVPPTLAVDEVPVGAPSAGFSVGYFGSPGRKDLLDVVVDAFVDVRRATGRQDLRLVIGGPGTREALEARELAGVELVGNLPQNEVSSLVGRLFATVLARPPARYADAGFPTKVVESLAVGTPVICNITSDLAEVVRDGETGWISDSPTVGGFVAAFSRAVQTTEHQRREMRLAARQTAESVFDLSNYVESLDDFLKRSE